MARYLLSVDGGGTKTEFCIRELEGRETKSFFTGSSNYKSVGVEGVFKSFEEGIQLLDNERNIQIDEIAYSVWGISGCDSKNDYEILQEQILKLGFTEKNSYICNDGILAFYAQAEEPGMVIIAGTGSIVIGVDEKGVCKRSGGWGYNISDVGSGYWIGNEALKKTLFYCDQLHEYSPLFERIRNLYGAEDFASLPFRLTQITDYFEVADLAKTVVELAGEGEAVSKGILKEGADVLAGLVKSTYDKLAFDETKKLNMVFSGGVLKSPEYMELLKRAIAKKIPTQNITFYVQKKTPAYGGLKLAERRAL